MMTIKWALGLALCVAPGAVQAQTTNGYPSCSAPEFRQFDFWVGDWDSFGADAPGKPAEARARIDHIAQRCAIHELYEQNDGLIGDSILSYDPVRKQWQQTWVTNRGSIMTLYGAFKDNAVELAGDVHLTDGRTIPHRITWRNEGDTVRESAVLSHDGGKTWQPTFDVVFRRRAPR